MKGWIITRFIIQAMIPVLGFIVLSIYKNISETIFSELMGILCGLLILNYYMTRKYFKHERGMAILLPLIGLILGIGGFACLVEYIFIEV